MRRKMFYIFFSFLFGGGIIFLNRGVFSQEQPTYVGIDKCKVCHTKEYESYKKRKFSKAWRVLEMRKKTKDPQCLKCHTTGYGKPGGFVSEEATPYLKYKQCEACHGPGSLHAKDPTNATAREALIKNVHQPDACTRCHRGVIAHRIGVQGF